MPIPTFTFAAATLGMTALPLLGAQPAFADYRICNQDVEMAEVSIAYHSKQQDTWISEGWWQIAPGRCVTVVSGNLANRYYYVYGQADNGRWDGKHRFCVSSRKFTIADADKDCTGSNRRWERFFEVDTGDARSWTTNLKP